MTCSWYRLVVSDSQVLLKSATGLLAMDRNGLSDPYCTLKTRDSSQRFTSEVKPKTLNPVWGSRFTFRSISSRDMLQVNVWDKVRADGALTQ